MHKSALNLLLDRLPIVARIRTNHGLEHATLHTLAQRYPGTNLGGYSSFSGFWIVGNLPTQAVLEGVLEGLRRLNAGEHRLAVHPKCGTNFATAGTLAGLAGAFAMFGAGKRWRDKLERLPLAATLATLMLILSQPLGLFIQEHVTTSAYPGSLEIVDIVRSQRGNMTVHQVITRG